MSNSRTKNAMLNITTSILLQAVIFLRGLILPRIIIPIYGSDVNGLVASITQFLTYISLLEAGVGSIFRASLYKPLATKDMDSVSGIINEQKKFYKKIGIIFGFYVVGLLVVYPLIAKTNVSAPYIISLILILSVSTFMEYFVSLPYMSLLSADQKLRIGDTVNIIYVIVGFVVSLLWASIRADIRLIYLTMCAVGLLRPLFYALYVKKHYNLNKKAPADKTALKQRWNGMAHHFAYYIHKNTDVAILTILVGTAFVSVYNIYGAIIFGISSVISSVSTGAAAGFGNVIVSGNKEQIDKTLDVFELVQAGLTTVLYSITALMLIPFIRIYTVNMVDVNYMQPAFGYVLIAAEAIYCFRCIYSTVSTNANKFKETQKGAILECAVNLGVSLILAVIFNLGLVGVAVGTALGALTRYVFEVVFLSKNVICRSVGRAAKMLLVSVSTSALSISVCHLLLDYEGVETVASWIIYAVISSAIVAVVAAVIYMAFYKKTIVSFIRRLKGR